MGTHPGQTQASRLSHPLLKSTQYGLWRILYQDSTRKSSRWSSGNMDRLQQLRDTPLLRFFRDVYSVDPMALVICMLGRCLGGIEQSLLMYLSAQIFNLVEAGLSSGTPDRRAIFLTLVARVVLTITIALWRRWTATADEVLETQVRLYFQQHLLEIHCTDLQDAFDFSSENPVPSMAPPQASALLFDILEVAQYVLAVLSQLVVLFTLAWSREDGKTFFIVCLAKPIYNLVFIDDLFSKPYFAYIHDEVYERMNSMWKIAMDPYFAKEIAACTLTDFLLSEYERARLALRGVSDRAPYSFMLSSAVTASTVSEILGPLPLIYVATHTLLYSGGVTIASALVVEQTSYALQGAFASLSMGSSRLYRQLTDIQVLYDKLDTFQSQQDTHQHLLPYPSPANSNISGMGIEVSGVSFRYPSPQDNDSAHYALKNVSFTLKPSSLTVIVGQNGSGKSSLARLLTGLCQPNTGEILVDGVKTSFYKRSDLSQATASLTQDHRLFPLTIAENIGLGDHGSRHNMGLIREAASLGGAANFIDKLADRYEHSLASLKTCFRMGELPEGPLADFANGFQMSAMVSGGEKQRLVAARTFMRLLSPRTKLVVADEPSAAIDPIGEYELFEKLREHRTGKTMVFISHRFGYLTKLADQILCMKDGELVEVGTHIELMALGGEYRKLYDVQAKAFVNSDEDLLASGSAS